MAAPYKACVCVCVCAVVRLLGLEVRIPPGGGRGLDVVPFVNVVCCQVEVSATGRSPVQGSSTECGVSDWV